MLCQKIEEQEGEFKLTFWLLTWIPSGLTGPNCSKINLSWSTVAESGKFPTNMEWPLAAMSKIKISRQDATQKKLYNILILNQKGYNLSMQKIWTKTCMIIIPLQATAATRRSSYFGCCSCTWRFHCFYRWSPHDDIKWSFTLIQIMYLKQPQ